MKAVADAVRQPKRETKGSATVDAVYMTAGRCKAITSSLTASLYRCANCNAGLVTAKIGSRCSRCKQTVHYAMRVRDGGKPKRGDVRPFFAMPQIEKHGDLWRLLLKTRRWMWEAPRYRGVS